MNELADILLKVEVSPKAQFLALGEWPELTTPLQEKGWRGTIISNSCDLFPAVPDNLPEREADTVTIHALLRMDWHFVRIASDVFVRPVTVAEILKWRAGPWRFWIVNVPSLNREIVASEEAKNAWPNLIVVKHEGQEQHIANLLAERSYRVVRVTRDAMLLERPKMQKGEE